MRMYVSLLNLYSPQRLTACWFAIDFMSFGSWPTPYSIIRRTVTTKWCLSQQQQKSQNSERDNNKGGVLVATALVVGTICFTGLETRGIFSLTTASVFEWSEWVSKSTTDDKDCFSKRLPELFQSRRSLRVGNKTADDCPMCVNVKTEKRIRISRCDLSSSFCLC